MTKQEEYLNLVMQSEFPYKKFDVNSLKKSYRHLKYNDYSKTNNVALDIIENYHPSIWRCSIKNHKAPIDAWNDPQIMLKVIENRFKYLRTDNLSIYNIRAGLSISKLAPKVSIFRPATAKYLIQKYLNNFDTIFDPCAGFSGRMLGTCCLGKKYIGQDINSITVKESKQIAEFLKLNVELNVEDSLYNTGIYDCLFTCPPYADKEIWHQDIEIYSADEWIDVCLKNYTCKTYLFVVDKTEKYKNYIIEEITNNSHFGSNTEKVILINK